MWILDLIFNIKSRKKKVEQTKVEHIKIEYKVWFIDNSKLFGFGGQEIATFYNVHEARHYAEMLGNRTHRRILVAGVDANGYSFGIDSEADYYMNYSSEAMDEYGIISVGFYKNGKWTRRR